MIKRLGFTFIEILIVITVISILSVYGIQNYNSGKQKSEYYNSVNLVHSAFKNAQNLTLKINNLGTDAGVVLRLSLNNGITDSLNIYTKDNLTNPRFIEGTDDMRFSLYPEDLKLEIDEFWLFDIDGNKHVIRENLYVLFSQHTYCQFIPESALNNIQDANILAPVPPIVPVMPGLNPVPVIPGAQNPAFPIVPIVPGGNLAPGVPNLNPGAANNDDPINNVDNSSYELMQIPLKYAIKEEQDILRVLQMQKIACLPELLLPSMFDVNN